MAKILNCVGGHDISVFREEDVEFDSLTKKFVLKEGAAPCVVVPFSGVVLRAAKEATTATDPVIVDGVSVPCTSEGAFVSVDALPDADADTLFIVSGLYAAACEALGLHTERLLTVDFTRSVVDAKKTPRGTLGFVRH